MPTYYAQREFSVESIDFKPGDEFGTGDIEAGDFTPAKGCEKVVELGHAVPRLARGFIGPDKPAPDAPAKRKTKPAKVSTNSKASDGE